jgi:hypothetical protein
MAARTDTKMTLPEARVCEICGVTQQYRKTLVDRELVRAVPRGGCTLRDALELVAIREMSGPLGTVDHVVAVTQLSAVLADTLPTGRFDVVYDLQHKLLSVARDDSQLRDLVSHGRLVRVFALGEPFAQTGDAFRRLAAAVVRSSRRSSPASSRKARPAVSSKRPPDDGGA